MMLIQLLAVISILGIFQAQSFWNTSLDIKRFEIQQYKRDMNTITDQQLTHKENYGYFKEFTLETTPDKKSYKSSTGTTFYVTSPNVSVKFYYLSQNCLAMETINYNLNKKTTWDSCDQLAVIHEDLN